jgi:hypothetical protein
LISTYPAARYAGYTATTSDLGPERSDGVRWLILDPPIPPAAAALGYTKLIYATHPVVADVGIVGTSASGQHYFVNGQPGINYGDSPSYFSTTDGQLTLAGGAAAPSIMAAATNDNGVAFADMNSALPFLPASSGYYIESATTCNTNVNDHWASFWMWTAEAMSNSYSSSWVEFDINEWGFDYAPHGDTAGATLFGVTSTLNNWSSLQTHTKHETYSPATLLMTDEHVMGGAWNPHASTPNVEQWVDGTKTGSIDFSAVDMPDSAWQGLHHFPIFGAGSHGYVSPAAEYKYQIRYVMAWGPP